MQGLKKAGIPSVTKDDVEGKLEDEVCAEHEPERYQDGFECLRTSLENATSQALAEVVVPEYAHAIQETAVTANPTGSHWSYQSLSESNP